MLSDTLSKKNDPWHRITSVLRSGSSAPIKSILVFAGLLLFLYSLATWKVFHSMLEDGSDKLYSSPLSSDIIGAKGKENAQVTVAEVSSQSKPQGGAGEGTIEETVGTVENNPQVDDGKVEKAAPQPSVLSPIPLDNDKKGLRQGLKLYEYTRATEWDIKRHRIKTLLLVFYDDASPETTATVQETLAGVAQVFAKQEILHVGVGASYLSDFMFFMADHPERDLPFAMIVEANNGWRKYKLPGRIDSTSLEAFETTYFAGKLRPFLRSEDPLDSDASEMAVRYMVATEFFKLVVQSKRDCLVLFYAPWCGHCKRLEPKFRDLAVKFEHIRSIQFLKMDVTKNDVDHPSVKIERVPYVRLFKSGSKLASPIKFDHTQLDVVEYGTNFLKTHSTCDIDIETGKDCNLEGEEEL